MRQFFTRDSFSSRMPASDLIVVATLAVAVLMLPVIAYLAGSDRGGTILFVATVCGAAAVTALVVIAIANVRLTRTADLEGARLRAIMTAMEDGVTVVDEAGRLTYMNGAAECMLDRRYEDHAGGELADVFRLHRRDDRPDAQDLPLLELILGGESYAGRDSVICGDGALLSVVVRTAPIVLDGERAGAVLVFADDTERTREEQAKDDFVGFASHELRSPLTAMHGFSSWLANKLEREPWRFDADTAEAIAALASETGRMESIIELFLDLTQIRMDRLSLEPDLLDLTKLLREEGASVRSRYPAATLEEVLPEGRVLAILDEQRLRQVVLNLLDNAAKYGGEKPQIVLSLTVAEGTAEFRVRDFGSGIPLDDQQHVFERFFRSAAPATGKKKGFGIGLYVTKQIVDRMDGELSFTSEEGSGTEFILRLPLTQDAALEAELAREDAEIAQEEELVLARA